MADYSKYVLSRLFIAVPELQVDEALLNILYRLGLVTPAQVETAQKVRSKSKKYSDLAGRMRNKTLIQRIMLIAPEVLSATTIDLLRRWDLVDAKTGNALRVALAAGKALVPGKISENAIFERLGAAGKSVLSFDMINLLRNLDEERIRRLRLGDDETLTALLNQSVRRGNILRSLLSTGRLTAETLALASKTRTVWGIIGVIGEGILSDRLLKDAIRVGAIDQGRYELLSALMKAGLNTWKKGAKALEYDSFAARALLMSEGILSPEMITALRAAKIISPELAKILYPAASAIRNLTRGQLDEYMGRVKIRVVPGESPLKTYARITGASDQELLKLLAQASRESRQTAERLARSPGFAKLTRSAQQRLIENALHVQMRALWEGVGHMTIFGEKEAARAALASMDFLQNSLWKDTSKAGADFRRSMRRSAEAGVDSFISRRERLLPLSNSVYKNINLANGLVSRRINIGLLRGLSAGELASDVSSLIRPNVRGGVSYASMRLARTEINNAFHNTSIRYTRDQPWVNGYKWHLSGSHPKPDECNLYAERDNDGLGQGIFKKTNVPGKPHPNCLCFVTAVTASNIQFERQLLNGSYDKYLKAQSSGGNSPFGSSWDSAYKEQADNLRGLAKGYLASAAGRLVARNILQITALTGVALRMGVQSGAFKATQRFVSNPKLAWSAAKNKAFEIGKTIRRDPDALYDEDHIGPYFSTSFLPINESLRRFKGNIDDVIGDMSSVLGLSEEQMDSGYNAFDLVSERFDKISDKILSGKSITDAENRFVSYASLISEGVSPRGFFRNMDEYTSRDRIQHDTSLYRVTSQSWFSGAGVGDFFQDHAYISTQHSKAEYFNGLNLGSLPATQRNNTRVTIRVPKGIRAAFGDPGQNEIVLHRGARFKVIDMRRSALPDAFDYDAIIEALPD